MHFSCLTKCTHMFKVKLTALRGSDTEESVTMSYLQLQPALDLCERKDQVLVAKLALLSSNVAPLSPTLAVIISGASAQAKALSSAAAWSTNNGSVTSTGDQLIFTCHRCHHHRRHCLSSVLLCRSRRHRHRRCCLHITRRSMFRKLIRKQRVCHWSV